MPASNRRRQVNAPTPSEWFRERRKGACSFSLSKSSPLPSSADSSPAKQYCSTKGLNMEAARAARQVATPSSITGMRIPAACRIAPVIAATTGHCSLSRKASPSSSSNRSCQSGFNSFSQEPRQISPAFSSPIYSPASMAPSSSRS